MAGVLIVRVLGAGWVGTEICIKVFVVGPAGIAHGGEGRASCSGRWRDA